MIVAPQNPHAAMANFSPPFFQLAFAKTATGKQAIETKHIPLSLVDRRVLLLVDGVKTGEELAMFCVGKDVSSILQSLLDQELIEIVATAAPPATTSGVPDTAPDTLSALPEPGDLGLPPASQRSAKEMEMARNFMINTVNTVFQPNTRLSLLEAIQGCNTATELRQVYLQWEDTLSTSRIGLKRLPEFKKKLFTVL